LLYIFLICNFIVFISNERNLKNLKNFKNFENNASNYLPVVIWHGMGDTCCFPFSMGAIEDEIKRVLPGIFTYSIMIGSNIVEDEISGFLGNANSQVESVCKIVTTHPILKHGFNALGFSQGSQFLRGLAEKCTEAKINNLITFGGQHMGVADIPDCVAINTTICETVEELLAFGAYTSFVQDIVIQAQYFKDPMDYKTYLEKNIYIADINNERPQKNSTYKSNLIKLNNFVMIKWLNDTVVVPKDSEWFGYYVPGSTSKILQLRDLPIYQEDWIGLKILDQRGSLKFLSLIGEHMQVDFKFFDKYVVIPYFS